MLFPDRNFQPSLMVVGYDRSLPKSREPERCSTYVDFDLKLWSIDLAGKASKGLAHSQITTVKSFIILDPGVGEIS